MGRAEESTGFLNTFIQTTTRENAGASSSNRFDFQKNWAICQLINLHQDAKDFLMVFEHHEDIVVLDSEENPSSGCFYQVKSKNKNNWTINSLVKQQKTKSSILQKLYSNHENFEGKAKQLCFVSNQGLSGVLRDNQKAVDQQEVTFFQLSNDDKEKIWKNIEPDYENAIACDFNKLNKLSFIRTKITHDQHDEITKGILAEFLQDIFPDQQISLIPVHRAIFDEVRRRTNLEIAPSSEKEFRQHKCMGKSEFEALTERIKKTKNLDEKWDKLSSELLYEGWNRRTLKNMEFGFKTYAMALLEFGDLRITKLQQMIQEGLNQSAEEISSRQTLDETTLFIKQNYPYAKDYPESFLKSAVLFNLCL